MEMQRGFDQAETLRAIRRQRDDNVREQAKASKTARVISVTSGKGGVGKTVCVANLAAIMAKNGTRVLVIDADLGLANIDLYFGLNPKYNLNHFFAGEKQLREILVRTRSGITILPAGSGVQKYTHLDSFDKNRLMEEIDLLHGRFDVVLIDTEGGISENVTFFTLAAQEIVVVTTPEPTALSDAYALMKLLSTMFNEKTFKLIVNSVVSENEALETYRKLTMVGSQFIDISIDFLGAIPLDKGFTDSVRKQKTLVELFPKSKASLAFEELVRNIESTTEKKTHKGSMQFFWKKMLSRNQA